MQRKRGTNHADWWFFTCNTNNRLGAGRCTGMYVREEDVFSAIYYQLKQYLKTRCITAPMYAQKISEFKAEIMRRTQGYEITLKNARRHYE